MLRLNTIAKVWTVEKSKINGYLNARISTSHKDLHSSSGYVTDFSAYVNVRANVGELSENDAIVIDEFSVSTAYNADTKKQYVNFYIERWHKYVKPMLDIS